MRRTLRSKFALLLFAGAIVLTGCARGGPAALVATDSASAKADARPSLVIPAKFETEEAKRLFVLKALDDKYYAEIQQVLEADIVARPQGHDYSLLGTTQYNLQEYDKAIQSWTKAADLDTNLAGEMHNNIGNALRDQKQPDAALAAYRKALELNPSCWSAAVNSADLLRSLGRIAEAVKVLEEATASNQDVKPLSAMLSSYRQTLANPDS